MTSPWIFVCPASRGIGQALTLNLLRRTALKQAPVLATTRNVDVEATKQRILRELPYEERQNATERLHMVRCDVIDESTVADAAELAKETFPRSTHHLRLAFAIPGVLTPERSPEKVEMDAAKAMFGVNALGPLLLAKHFMGFLPKRLPVKDESNLPPYAIWVNMSARVGSTNDNRSGGWFSYRASKAAVISLTKSLDIHLAQHSSAPGSMVVAYHPGTVKTDFSREFWGNIPEGKLFEVDDAAEKMVRVILALRAEQRGRCWDWKGDEILP